VNRKEVDRVAGKKKGAKAKGTKSSAKPMKAHKTTRSAK